jgi:hypothetical protein
MLAVAKYVVDRVGPFQNARSCTRFRYSWPSSKFQIPYSAECDRLVSRGARHFEGLAQRDGTEIRKGIECQVHEQADVKDL